MDQVITFGASYKMVEEEWEEWLRKFECILKQMYWISATIHLDAERVEQHTNEWVADGNYSGDSMPTTSWDFSGGPRSFVI